MRLSRPAIAFLLAAGGITAQLSTFSAQAIPSSSAMPLTTNQADARVAEQGRALLALAEKTEQGELAQLVSVAQQRHRSLLDLASQNPEQVFPLLLSADDLRALPAAARPHLEQQILLEGRLELNYLDFEDGSHQLQMYLRDDAGERVTLHLDALPPGLTNGRRVQANGALLSDDMGRGDHLFVADSEQNMLVLALEGGADGGSNGGIAQPTDAATGEQKTLVMLVNFADDASTPWTREQAYDVVFGQSNDYMLENSAGQTWLSGDVTGWYTLPLSKQSCDNSDIVSAALAQAEMDGVDLSAYNRFVYAFPYTSACAFSGVGSVGGKTSSMLLNGAMRFSTFSHEMGHNLGLYHSHALECGGETLGGSCVRDEYGDSADMMGRMQGQFNAFQKTRLNWLAPEQVATVTEGNRFVLTGLANSTAGGLKALKVPKGIDEATGKPGYYWVEYREPVGSDAVFAGNDNIVNGVVIRQATDGDGDSSYLLDMTPGSGASNYADTRDPALAVGSSFIDEQAGVSISLDAIQSGQAQLTIALDGYVPGEQCLRAQPALMVTPGLSPAVKAGSQVTYQLSVTNNDSAACDPSSFGLSAVVPSGWTQYLNAYSLNLAPGQSGTANLMVSSASSAADGDYDVRATASGLSGTRSQLVSYRVGTTPEANRAPVAANDSATTEQDKAVTIAVLANDKDPDGDALTVTGTSGVNGSAVINGDGSIGFTPAAGFSGSEVFSYSVSDGKGGSASATVTVSVVAAEPSNKAPVAVDDSATVQTGQSVTIAVLANDRDADGDSLRVSRVAQGSKGAVSLNGDGSLTYTPAKNFKGSDSFSYTITDGQAEASASVVIGTDGGSGSDSGGKGNGKGPGR